MTSRIFISLALSFSVVTTAMAADPDIDAGKKVFKKCSSCHSLDSGKNKVGPTLFNVLDSKAASVEKYKYSKAMRKSDLVWTEENLAGFLKKPKRFLKGTKMSFAGIKKPEQITNLIAYLKSTKSD